MTHTLFLTVLTDGHVACTIHPHTKTGRVRKLGHTFTIAPWDQVVKFLAPAPTCRVIVRTATQETK
jgi:hypothetical protein